MKRAVTKSGVSTIMLVAASIVLFGCTSTWQNPPAAEQGAAHNDPLSYGSVTAKVKKGETTQEDIVRLFGAPNITTTNSDGEEVWVYDRISNASQQNGWSEARRFSAFFILEGYSGKEGSSHGSSTQTLTVIISFDKAKKVRDYSARATQF